jgi:putative tricarboxylic transport membrane protein
MIRVKEPFDFIDRPIAAILFGFIILVIVLHIRTLIIEHRNREPDADHNLHDTQMR